MSWNSAKKKTGRKSEWWRPGCYDMESANREGIRAIGVLYGYGSKEELEEAGADGLAETPEEVVRMILNGMHP